MEGLEDLRFIVRTFGAAEDGRGREEADDAEDSQR